MSEFNQLRGSHMTNFGLESLVDKLSGSQVDRRKFFRQAGMFGFGAAVSGMMLSGTEAKAQANGDQTLDSTDQLFTAFLIAEDLATTFYYNGLIGGVIQDSNLAGPGGTATNVSSGGNAGNVDYLRAALGQEIEHGAQFRYYLTGSEGGFQNDPYQTFYFPAGTFDTLAPFLGILNALENAFIGAYMTVIQEFSYKATLAASGSLKGADAKYSAKQYELFAKLASTILGVEAEHRVLGRVIGNVNPANNLLFEQTDGLQAIFHGPYSAVLALTPFLTPSTGPGYSFATAFNNHGKLTVASSGGPPTS
jgi:Ferritin-like domain